MMLRTCRLCKNEKRISQFAFKIKKQGGCNWRISKSTWTCESCNEQIQIMRNNNSHDVDEALSIGEKLEW